MEHEQRMRAWALPKYSLPAFPRRCIRRLSQKETAYIENMLPLSCRSSCRIYERVTKDPFKGLFLVVQLLLSANRYETRIYTYMNYVGIYVSKLIQKLSQRSEERRSVASGLYVGNRARCYDYYCPRSSTYCTKFQLLFNKLYLII